MEHFVLLCQDIKTTMNSYFKCKRASGVFWAIHYGEDTDIATVNVYMSLSVISVNKCISTVMVKICNLAHAQ